MARILAVDDSPSMRRMVSVTLASAGHSVEQAEDGCEALVAAKREVFDLIVTDVNMPNMDGITLVRQLRELAQYKFVPLLILTTEGTAERKIQGREAGATGWLVKPFNPERLLAIVSKVVS
jgi:two-component system, chemotaxis family, chemotaxis protein CheY